MKHIQELLVDLYGCESDLDNVQFLQETLVRAAQEMGSTVIKTTSHEFSPTGITVIAVLAETHMSIHTWPEYKYAALDIFICSESINPRIGWNTVKEALNPTTFKVHNITRRIK